MFLILKPETTARLWTESLYSQIEGWESRVCEFYYRHLALQSLTWKGQMTGQPES